MIPGGDFKSARANIGAAILAVQGEISSKARSSERAGLVAAGGAQTLHFRKKDWGCDPLSHAVTGKT
jgi:hypothetical protein